VATPFVGGEVPDLESILAHCRPRNLLLVLPLRTVLGKMFSPLGLVLVLAPPALGGGLVLRPLEVLAGEAAACLRLVKTRYNLLASHGRNRVWFLTKIPLSAISVFLPGDPGSRPCLGFPPFLISPA